MTEIKLYKTTTKGLKLIGMCLPFIAIGIWMNIDKPYGSTEHIMGCFGTCFFGLGLLAGLFQTFDKRPQIIITEKGIWDRTTNQNEVNWEQIIEAYSFDIHGQKFISLVTNDKFVFKKKPYKWTAKINEFVGATNLNLYLGQIDIDENDLTNLINQLSRQSIDDRRNTIKTLKVKRTIFAVSDLRKILIYIFIALIILVLTLSSFVAFWIVIGITGVSALIARWRPDNPNIKKYAAMVTWLGFINMVLLFGTMKAYDKVTEEVAEKLAIEIEEFQKQNTKFPIEIKSITSKLELNIIERNFIEQIDYKTLNNDYELETTMIFGKRRKYDKNIGEWN